QSAQVLLPVLYFFSFFLFAMFESSIKSSSEFVVYINCMNKQYQVLFIKFVGFLAK
ncbi:hypothetical protein AAUPMC_18749, partial [Pasteurella multocida subsp. multocida str. Anand1_cattle]